MRPKFSLRLAEVDLFFSIFVAGDIMAHTPTKTVFYCGRDGCGPLDILCSLMDFCCGQNKLSMWSRCGQTGCDRYRRLQPVWLHLKFIRPFIFELSDDTQQVASLSCHFCLLTFDLLNVKWWYSKFNCVTLSQQTIKSNDDQW